MHFHQIFIPVFFIHLFIYLPTCTYYYLSTYKYRLLLVVWYGTHKILLVDLNMNDMQMCLLPYYFFVCFLVLVVPLIKWDF